MNRPISNIAVLLLALVVSSICQAQEALRTQATAPKDQAIVGETLGGYYFAPIALKEMYDKLLNELHTLEAQISAGEIGAAEARNQIAALREDLEAIQKRIDEVKTYVATALVESRSETTTIELGPEKTLFIIADKVRLIGWDQPEVKCVLEKTVLHTGKEDLDEQFKGIRLEHRQQQAKTEHVGFSARDVAESQQKYLESADGQKLNAEQAVAWKKNFEKIFRSGGIFTDFQNKDIDIVEIAGITHQQGNRQLTFEVKSPGGGGRMGSIWQRHASLTVYVPQCKVLGVLGGAAGLEVESLKVATVIRGSGNRDYHAAHWVKDHTGALTVENIALQSVENVQGPVSITITADLDNSSTSHRNQQRIQSYETPQLFACRNIRGDFTAHLVRSKLHLEGISGRIDVWNEFGDTTLTAKQPLAATAHRVLSQGGHIELRLDGASLDKSPPLLALTECGTVRVSTLTQRFEDVHFTTFPEGRSIRRGFMGVKSAAGADRFDFRMFDRVSDILQNGDRGPGIDLISRGGSLHIAPAE